MSEGRGALVNFLLFFRGSGGREREGFPMISDFLGFLILLMRAGLKHLKTLSYLHLRRDETPAPSLAQFLQGAEPGSLPVAGYTGWLCNFFPFNSVL